MTKIIKYTILLYCFFCCFVVRAQLTAEKDRIFISVIPPENNEIPAEAAKQIDFKMNQLLMQNGIANDDPINRFILYTKVSVLSKEIIAGPPQKIAMDLDFTFIIGDAEENKKFESVTISTKGVGTNENKAFIAAIKNIKPKNPELVAFLDAAKKEIIDYYSLKCFQIKNQAQTEAGQRNYEKAIYLLMQIPDVCDCAYECQNLAIEYSQEWLNNNAAALLNQAKSLWASNPNAQGAAAAADVIAQIPANTTSQAGVDNLISEINTKLRTDERNAWEFKMKQYNDKVEKQKRYDQARLEQQRADNIYRDKQQTADNEYRAKQQIADNQYRVEQQKADNAHRDRQQAADNKARSQSIEAARQIGIAYAKNQPKSVNYQKNVILW